MAELHIAFLIDAGSIVEKALISRQVGRVELGNFVRQRSIVVRIIEVSAIRPIESVKGHDRIEDDVVGHAAPRKRPKFLQAVRVRNDSWTGIESEAVLLPEIGAPARLVACFDDRRLDAGRLQTNTECEPPKS